MSSIFGAFGSSVVDFFKVLEPLSYILLFITVLSVYGTEKKICYLPFILALLDCCVILVGQLAELLLLITVGNLGLVATVLWNNRILKKDEGEESKRV